MLRHLPEWRILLPVVAFTAFFATLAVFVAGLQSAEAIYLLAVAAIPVVAVLYTAIETALESRKERR